MTAWPMALVTAPWIIAVVALPFACATLAFVRRGRGRWLLFCGAAAASISAAGVTWQVRTIGPQRYEIGGWGAPLGIELYADGLSAAMLAMTAVIGLAVTIYAAAYFEAEAPDASSPGAVALDFGPLWLFLWASLNALFLSGDLFNLYVTLELMTLAAVGLVATARTPEATSAALEYLLAALFGSLFYLLGTALLYAAYGTLDLVSLARVIGPGLLPSLAIAAIVAGLAMKGALFPFHFWLPPAHANAPAPVSAVLSGLVVTASFYLLLRLWFDVFSGAITVPAGRVLASLGAAAIVWGSLQALLTPRLKSLVAYSTVAQLGYLAMVFGLVVPDVPSGAWSGGVLFAISHACAKAAMFMAAGIVLHVASHDRIADLYRTGRRLPTTFFTIALASVTLMGLPPSGSFVAKWMLLDAALESGQLVFAGVIVAGGVLAAAYLFRVLGGAFTSSPDESVTPVPRQMEWAALALAAIALSLGLGSAPLLDLLMVGGGRR